ncbi:MAG: hypothetical protein R2754_14980 [Microthrixaceae bacterium]
MSTLLVVGGAGTTGHWSVRYLSGLSRPDGAGAPASVLVADTDPDVVDRLPQPVDGGPALEAVVLVVSPDGTESTVDGRPLAELARDAAQVWVAVPPDGLAAVADSLRPGLAQGDASVVVFSAAQVVAAQAFAGVVPAERVVGIHLLVGPETPDPVGHTAVVCVDPTVAEGMREDSSSPVAAAVALVTEAGMRPIHMSPTDHDRAMAWVEGVSEFVLLALGEALVDSGVPLELLWEVRTPTFELLAALVARTYDTVRYEQVASAQLGASRTDPLVRESFRRAVSDLSRRVDADTGVSTEHLVESLDRVARGLPTWFRRSLAQGSEGAVEAVRRTERHLTAAARDGSLVGIRRLSGGPLTHVGWVREADDDQLLLDDRLVATPHGAVLVDGSWPERFLTSIGTDARVGPVSLRLHNHATVTGAELDAWRAASLARYRLVLGVDWPTDGSEHVELGATIAALAPAEAESVEVTDRFARGGLTRATVEAVVRSDHDPQRVADAWSDALVAVLSPDPVVRHSVPGPAT